MLGPKAQQGDTIIEVLLAATIFSMVAVAGLTIMNHGTSAAQRSLEVSLVRHEIDSQAEALRLMYDEAIAEEGSGGYEPTSGSPVDTNPTENWQEVIDLRKDAASDFSAMVSGDGVTCTDRPDNAFVVNAKTLKVQDMESVWQRAPVYSRVLYASDGSSLEVESVEGIWIEAEVGVPKRDGVPGYTDFHIRACWSTIGQGNPVTLGTIVRLYEP